MTKEEWDRLFERAMPIVSLVAGTLSVALGTMSLMRAGSLGRRVYSQDGRYLVSVRYPGVWRDLREFVQPNDPDVMAVYYQYGPDYWSLYDFVCRNIEYRLDVGEFWQTPSETLRSNHGDCEDTSILLCSLLQNAHVALGSYQEYGHAWCQLGNQILETTYTYARQVPDPRDYCPYCLFNESEVIELWPGALGKVFELGRNEQQKLALMAEAIR